MTSASLLPTKYEQKQRKQQLLRRPHVEHMHVHNYTPCGWVWRITMSILTSVVLATIFVVCCYPVPEGKWTIEAVLYLMLTMLSCLVMFALFMLCFAYGFMHIAKSAGLDQPFNLIDMRKIDLERANMAPRKVTLVKGTGKIGTEHFKNFITVVKPGSVADKHFLKHGDEIIAINGVEVDAETTIEQIKKLLGETGDVEMVVRYDPLRCNEATEELFMNHFF